jgi:hypothetical protein
VIGRTTPSPSDPPFIGSQIRRWAVVQWERCFNHRRQANTGLKGAACREGGGEARREEEENDRSHAPLYTTGTRACSLPTSGRASCIQMSASRFSHAPLPEFPSSSATRDPSHVSLLLLDLASHHANPPPIPSTPLARQWRGESARVS